MAPARLPDFAGGGSHEGAGFPFSYEIFDGNRADVATVEAILRTVELKHGKARRVWIFDRGVVSEENLAAIRKRGGQYLVGHDT